MEKIHTVTFDWGHATLETRRVISCYGKDNRLLGTILANDTDWGLILAEHDPIDERWEDGCGNILSRNGWGL